MQPTVVQTHQRTHTHTRYAHNSAKQISIVSLTVSHKGNPSHSNGSTVSYINMSVLQPLIVNTEPRSSASRISIANNSTKFKKEFCYKLDCEKNRIYLYGIIYLLSPCFTFIQAEDRGVKWTERETDRNNRERERRWEMQYDVREEEKSRESDEEGQLVGGW